MKKHVEIISVIRILRMAVVLLCCLLLSGCGEGEHAFEDTIQVYFVNNEETKVVARDYAPKHRESTEKTLEELLVCLGTNPEKLEYKPPLAMGFELLKAEYAEGRVTLDFSEAYQKLPVTTQVLVRAAIVRTLTQVEGVTYVAITVAGNQLFDSMGNLVGFMNAEQFIDNDGSDINTYELARVKLYFANEDGTKLIAAYREKHYSTNISLERFVVEELIQGPSGQIEGLFPCINPSTRIINVMTKDGICYVNLDESFLTVVNNVSIESAIYAVTNSLVELTNINKVQILINGEVPTSFSAAYYERNLDLVTVLEE